MLGNVYDPACPTRQVLDRIADKWTVLILGLVAQRPARFNQLKRSVAGISQKMLSQTLRGLERDGLVSRTVFATVPVTVEYAATPLGRTLAEQLASLSRWAETHFPDVLEAQASYDAAAARSPRPVAA